ncbi:MAG: aminodeoxychorismate synthase component [Pseudomonadota bacterium]
MAGRIPDSPFVLLDDARSGKATPARLYRDPLEIVTAHDAASLSALLDRLATGHAHWAGFLTYEAGLLLEGRLADRLRPAEMPLAWFGRFDGFEDIAPEDVPALLPDAAGGWAGAPRPKIGRAAYDAALAKVQALISAGDIYQANLTIRAEVSTAGHPLALFAGLRQRAKAGFGGVIWTGEDWLLSLSPELFFALHDGKVTTKPMKGTSARGATPDEDVALIARLQSDPKQRAENLMIVDLLRNDVSRVAEPGSVEVPQLFKVETYPTVHQMISTVTARLQPGKAAADVLRAIYPCGSITGAPKIRAMEVIDAVEETPRGIYTGSIGRVDPNGDAAFNVAIRTLHLPAGQSIATLGLGGGIVADSRVAEEWAECLAKGRFVADQRCFDLIETMRFDPEQGIERLDLHLARMRASAQAFDFSFDRHAVRNELQAATFRLREAKRIRLLLAKSGAVAIEISNLPPAPVGPVAVAVVPLPVDVSDFRLVHKTSDRAFYDEARAKAGAFEVVFTDADGFLTEGSFTTLYVERDGVLLTPPLSRHLLPGTLRSELIEAGRAKEADVRPEDLANGFFIGNAIRGILPARIA